MEKNHAGVLLKINHHFKFEKKAREILYAYFRQFLQRQF